VVEIYLQRRESRKDNERVRLRQRKRGSRDGNILPGGLPRSEVCRGVYRKNRLIGKGSRLNEEPSRASGGEMVCGSAKKGLLSLETRRRCGKGLGGERTIFDLA